METGLQLVNGMGECDISHGLLLVNLLTDEILQQLLVVGLMLAYQ